MNDALVSLSQNEEAALQRQETAMALASELEKALARTTIVEETVEVRRRAGAYAAYTMRRMAYEVSRPFADLEVRAIVKAGRQWAVDPRRRKRGHSKSQNSEISQNGEIGWEIAFFNAQDASISERCGQLHDEDVRTYLENIEPPKHPTQHGIYSIWREMFGSGNDARPWLRVYNVWGFQSPDPALGQEHPGQIPGQIMQNLNWYYTEPGDLVVDMFAGGGSTIDVCGAKDDDYGNRKCKAYDIRPARDDIKKWDVVSKGLPPGIGDAALVFLDPPYWKQKKGEYSEDATNLANLSLAEFHVELAKIIKAARATAKTTALIIGATQEGNLFHDHAAEIISRVGIPSARIIVPYQTQQYEAFSVARAKEQKQFLNLYRDLLIWKK